LRFCRIATRTRLPAWHSSRRADEKSADERTTSVIDGKNGAAVCRSGASRKSGMATDGSSSGQQPRRRSRIASQPAISSAGETWSTEFRGWAGTTIAARVAEGPAAEGGVEVEVESFKTAAKRRL
jgi:hypothetical protein